jgi:hypothetical protein
MKTALTNARAYWEQGKVGYALLWLLGVPLPILLLVYVLRGCS